MGIQKFLLKLALLSLLSLTACQTFKENVRTNRGSTVAEGSDNESVSSEDNVAVIKDSSFTEAKAPKLGIILSGGGVLSYAQIGVLHELSKQKINVQSIVGLEWGALVAASYSKSGRAHEVEWQLLKLPKALFSKKGMFSRGEEGVDVSRFSDYLDKTFSKSRIQEAKIPFACPYMNLKKAKTQVSTKGFYKNVLKACWPHPPQFKPDAVTADILAVEKAVTFLRSQGAEVILYVDVLGDNLLMTSKDRKKSPMAAMMWMQAKKLNHRLKNFGVDEVISLPLSGGHLMSYDSMRMMIRMGQMKSRGFIKQFAKKYGY